VMKQLCSIYIFPFSFLSLAILEVPPFYIVYAFSTFLLWCNISYYSLVKDCLLLVATDCLHVLTL
jgi:hypothetical protein